MFLNGTLIVLARHVEFRSTDTARLPPRKRGNSTISTEKGSTSRYSLWWPCWLNCDRICAWKPCCCCCCCIRCRCHSAGWAPRPAMLFPRPSGGPTLTLGGRWLLVLGYPSRWCIWCILPMAAIPPLLMYILPPAACNACCCCCCAICGLIIGPAKNIHVP